MFSICAAGKPFPLPPSLARTLLALLLSAVALPALAQDRVVTSTISIEQDKLAAGQYSTVHVLESGRQLFAASYLPADGHGEGPNGPRSTQRRLLWPQVPGVADPYIPFLRVNGLDSQSCFACHNTAGTYVPHGSQALARKPGGVGGAGDFAVVLLGSQTFPQPLTHIVRATPRAFGSGYLQELAIEMTADLLGVRAATLAAAKADPGTPATRPLVAKGVHFGEITITCPDAQCMSPVTDTSHVEGVSPDLIVRPLQHKGIASTLRSFVRSALDFHFSLQTVEVYGINTDCDQDGLVNELAVDNRAPVGGADPGSSRPVQQSLGNVAALSAFTGMLRPPQQTAMHTPGEQLFDDIGCTGCHVPRLTTGQDPQLLIRLAAPAAEGCPPTSRRIPLLGSFSEERAEIHPMIRAARAMESMKGKPQKCPPGYFCIDLSRPGGLPGEFEPRLPTNPDGTVDVHLYSDLKRHDMGQYLAQAAPPQADDSGNEVPGRQWLTSKLWGVADNGPWLHDGRARTLDEAIVMHAGPDGRAADSEASPVIQKYLDLSDAERRQIVDFLGTLTIPIPRGCNAGC